jgi:hypothetical protein
MREWARNSSFVHYAHDHKKVTWGFMMMMLCVVLRDHKYVSVPINLVAVPLYFTAVAQLQILKTMDHVSHLLW